VAEVFLSYGRADAAVAARVARALNRSGLSVWFDRDLPAHEAYSDVIAAELESARAVLVLWSRASVESHWVRSEANRACELGKLVQARLDDARLPMPFDQIQCADLQQWRGRSTHIGWAQVRRSIDALVGLEPSPSHQQVRNPDRRSLLFFGGATMLAAGAGGWLWFRERNAEPASPEAALLLQKGIDALQTDDVFEADNPGSLKDAIALLSEATEADPRSATAWGSLALAYAALKRVSLGPQRPGLASRCRSAAERAFQIDAHEARATGALLLLKPLYRHWLTAEVQDRQALRSATQKVPLLFFIMSDMLRSVGRCREASAASAGFNRKAFIIPGADEQVLIDLWSAGDLQGADGALRLAIQHWPQHPQVWRTRIGYLMYSGRASEALDLLHDPNERPSAVTDDLASALTSTALALTGQGDARQAVTRNLAYLKVHPLAVEQALHACAALGDAGAALAILQGYYLAQGEWAKVAPAAGDEDRKTDFLFQPPMKPLWPDPRFGALLRRVGLEDYWRQSGTRPDFRRMA
jgi:hypothetical protein